MIPHRSKWRMFVAAILSAILLFVPVATGLAAAGIIGQTNQLAYEEVNSPELDELAQRAIDDNGVQQLVKHLTDKEADLVGKRATKWQFDGHEGNVVLLNYKGKKDVQIVYSESDGNVKVGAGVFTTTDKKTQIEAYDLVDGKIYHASTISFAKDSDGKSGKPSVKWHSSPLMKDPKAIGSPPDFSVSSSCSVCKSVCYYIYAGGCGISGYFVCIGACAPFGTLTCPLICAVVWAIICQYGQGTSCPLLCANAGYC